MFYFFQYKHRDTKKCDTRIKVSKTFDLITLVLMTKNKNLRTNIHAIKKKNIIRRKIMEANQLKIKLLKEDESKFTLS